jgi:hypothetical protein
MDGWMEINGRTDAHNFESAESVDIERCSSLADLYCLSSGAFLPFRVCGQ